MCIIIDIDMPLWSIDLLGYLWILWSGIGMYICIIQIMYSMVCFFIRKKALGHLVEPRGH